MEHVNHWLIVMFASVQVVLWVKMVSSFDAYFEILSYFSFTLFCLGTQCETERNECETVNPCLNSGRGIDHFNNFSCMCAVGKI